MKRLLICLFIFSLLLSTAYCLLSIAHADSTTSVTVPPQVSDFQLSFAQDVTSGTIPQNTDITYTITYGASQSAGLATDDTLTATFNQDTSDGTTHVTDYVFGSATNAYNDTPPIIDLINRKITWNISQMPAGTTDQIVTFKLRTNTHYTGTNQIPITTTADFSNDFISMPQQSLTTHYLFQIPAPSTHTITPSPTPILTPSVTPTPSNPLQINDIQFTEVTPTSITISIETTQKTRLNAFYGVSPSSLFQLIADPILGQFHTIQLTKLTPQTTYYLQLAATDENGNSTKSDILQFTTAKGSSLTHIDQQSVILVSGNNPLVNADPSLPFAQVLLPNSQAYTVGLRISAWQSIKNIIALIQNSHVLGTNTFSTYSQNNMWSAPMIQEQPGVYIAQLSAPPIPGTYDVLAQVSDTNGNITQTKIAQAFVYGSLHVVDSATNKGIEHARNFLSLYNPTRKTYDPIPFSQIQDNPIFTDKNGLAILNNGSGKYKILVSQYGYKSQTITFPIDTSHIFLPVIRLAPIGFSLSEIIQYYTNTTLDFTGRTLLAVQKASSATRYFQLISAVVLMSLIFLTFLLFLLRTKLTLVVIPLFIKHHTQKDGSVHGQIIDEITRRPIALATLAISDRTSHEVLTTSTSNNKGIFYLKSEWASSDNILNILAPGYRTNKFALNEDLLPAVIYLRHNLVGGPFHNPLVATLRNFVGLFFETLLVMSFILEIFFIQNIGTWGILFVILSLFNLLLWLLYQREKAL